MKRDKLTPHIAEGVRYELSPYKKDIMTDAECFSYSKQFYTRQW